jgi:uncharacterized membrane protein
MDFNNDFMNEDFLKVALYYLGLGLFVLWFVDSFTSIPLFTNCIGVFLGLVFLSIINHNMS